MSWPGIKPSTSKQKACELPMAVEWVIFIDSGFMVDWLSNKFIGSSYIGRVIECMVSSILQYCLYKELTSVIVGANEVHITIMRSKLYVSSHNNAIYLIFFMCMLMVGFTLLMNEWWLTLNISSNQPMQQSNNLIILNFTLVL